MTGFDVPEQDLHLRLVGGLRARGTETYLPFYRGTLDSSLGAISMEIVVDQGGVFPPQDLVSTNGVHLYGHGQHPMPDLEDERLQRVDADVEEFRIAVPAQTVTLQSMQTGAYAGTLRTAIGEWTVDLRCGRLSLRIGTGRAESAR